MARPLATNQPEEMFVNTMRAVQVPQAKGPFEIVEREIPQPGPGSVRVKVQACGVCHSDVYSKEGLFPGMQYPLIPGHEVVGLVDAVGPGVSQFQPGDRVGAGWNGGYCGYCDNCRRGNFFACQTMVHITGITRHGGYAEYMVARAEALARVPEKLSAADAAPLMCAGVTTYNCLRNSGARAGDVVAILGLGGLGHLGVQFASKMGFQPVVIARDSEEESLAAQLGATHYINNRTQDATAELQRLGGATAILATAAHGPTMSALIGGLAPKGTLMIIGVPPSLEVSPALLVRGSLSVKGWYSGTAIDSQDTMRFSAAFGVQSMNEVFPLERVNEAYERMLSGKARFRVVLSVGN